MIEFTPDLLLRLGIAVLGGAVIGLAILVQIVLRDAFGDGSALLSQRQRRMGLVLRIAAAIAAFAIAILILRLVSEKEGRTVLGAMSVLAGLLISVTLGKRVIGTLTVRVRNRFLDKKATAI